MRKIRRAAPELLGFMLVLLGASLWIMSAAAAPPDPATVSDPHVTFHEMRSFVFVTIGLSGLAVVGGVWTVFDSILKRDRQLRAENLSQLTVAVSELGGGLKKAIEALDRHNADQYAHGPASEHNHVPLLTKIEHIETNAEKIEAQAETIENRLDDFIRFCKTHQCAMGQRNPSDSPSPKRENDSEDDYTALRGKR